MLQKKICLLGSYAVGKTSLVRRYVHNEFSDRYLTNIGVKVDTKLVTTRNQEVTLLIWDVHGQDHFQNFRRTYMRGAAGYLLVIDGTRRETLQVAREVQNEAEEVLGKVPFFALINKVDLQDHWGLTDDDFDEMRSWGWIFHKTSAKTGQFVDDVFQELADQILFTGDSNSDPFVGS